MNNTVVDVFKGRSFHARPVHLEHRRICCRTHVDGYLTSFGSGRNRKVVSFAETHIFFIFTNCKKKAFLEQRFPSFTVAANYCQNIINGIFVSNYFSNQHPMDRISRLAQHVLMQHRWVNFFVSSALDIHPITINFFVSSALDIHPITINFLVGSAIDIHPITINFFVGSALDTHPITIK